MQSRMIWKTEDDNFYDFCNERKLNLDFLNKAGKLHFKRKIELKINYFRKKIRVVLFCIKMKENVKRKIGKTFSGAPYSIAFLHSVEP